MEHELELVRTDGERKEKRGGEKGKSREMG